MRGSGRAVQFVRLHGIRFPYFLTQGVRPGERRVPARCQPTSDTNGTFFLKNIFFIFYPKHDPIVHKDIFMILTEVKVKIFQPVDQTSKHIFFNMLGQHKKGCFHGASGVARGKGVASLGVQTGVAFCNGGST